MDCQEKMYPATTLWRFHESERTPNCSSAVVSGCAIGSWKGTRTTVRAQVLAPGLVQLARKPARGCNLLLAIFLVSCTHVGFRCIIHSSIH